MKTVAVEQGLQPVKEYLEQKGCQVVEMTNANTSVGNASVIVVTGGDENLMGMDDVISEVPVITANGLSPEQVYQRVERYIH